MGSNSFMKPLTLPELLLSLGGLYIFPTIILFFIFSCLIFFYILMFDFSTLFAAITTKL